MKPFLSFGISLLILIITCSFRVPVSLVPETPSKAPDYFCTWNVQGYVCSYMTNADERMAMNEKNMFGDSIFQNWVDFFPKIRKDLFFVMDDSWDVPSSANSMKNNDYLGSVELNQERFPSFTGNPAERLRKIVKAVEKKGWKGLGGWICAQEAPLFGNVDSVAYWIERLKAANEAGFDYWKVDWGKNEINIKWRKMLTRLGHTYAPNLIIEHALDEKYVSISDVYRTYDVENIISQPVTIQRIVKLLKYKPQSGAKGIINCEDEPYIAVGLGCAIGIMRHPFSGNLPNGKIDICFPPVGRNLKHRMDEIIRAVRWHRIAEPFGIGSDIYNIDTVKLNDYWVLGKDETWVKSRKIGDILRVSAPARVSRGLPLADVISPMSNQPFVLTSMYPNGSVAIVTIGRAINREYITERVKVEQVINNIDHPIGIFGDYESLTLVLPKNLKISDYEVWSQDLAGEKPLIITKDIIFKENRIIISGDIIRKVGLSASSKDDLSDPGLVLKFIRK